jgi:hypothetical protein
MTEAGIGTRVELTRTVSDSSTSSPSLEDAVAADGLPAIGRLELELEGLGGDLLPSEPGSVGRFLGGEDFCVFSLLRPDCPKTAVGKQRPRIARSANAETAFGHLVQEATSIFTQWPE